MKSTTVNKNKPKCINCGLEFISLFSGYEKCVGCGLYRNTQYLSKNNLKQRLKLFLLSASHNKTTEKIRLGKAQEQMDVLNKYNPQKGRVFDVAAASGFFLKKARDNGWEIEGNEISVAAVNWANKHYGINIINGYFEDIELKLNHYDAVVFWNSLEHMHNPMESLKLTHNILKENGLIYIRVPNKNTLDLLRKYIEPFHSYEFSYNNLHEMLIKNNFKKIFHVEVPDKVPTMDFLYKKI